MIDIIAAIQAAIKVANPLSISLIFIITHFFASLILWNILISANIPIKKHLIK